MLIAQNFNKFGFVEEISERLTGRGLIHKIVRTPNGYHVLSEPFDVRLLEGIPDVEVKKDGMTYIEYLEMMYNGK